MIAHIPGNILQGNWRAAVYLDERVDAGAGGGASQGLHRQARRSGRRSREAGRRGGVGRESADHVRRAGRQGNDQDRQRRLRRARAVSERDAAPRRRWPIRCSRRFRARRCSSARRRATARRTPSSASTSTSRATTRCRARSSSTPRRTVAARTRASRAIARGRTRRTIAPQHRARRLGRQARALFSALHGGARRGGLGGAVGCGARAPTARYLEHGGWVDAGALARALPRVPAAARSWSRRMLHAAAWVLMIAAMMLPTTFPLLAIFRRMTARTAGCGAAARAGRRRLFRGVARLRRARARLPTRRCTGRRAASAGSSPTAGWSAPRCWQARALFQFSALKYRCLEQCRTPFGFVAARWHGRSPRARRSGSGSTTALFCVGCCWALMLLMFVVGMGSIGWMLVLAALMAAEKNLPWGRRLRTPVGLWAPRCRGGDRRGHERLCRAFLVATPARRIAP